MGAQKTFYVDLNLNGNELKYAVLQNSSLAPSNPKRGQIYFNTSDNQFYYYDGSSWITGRTYTFSSIGTDQDGASIIYSSDNDQLVLKRLVAEGTGISVVAESRLIKIGLNEQQVVYLVTSNQDFLDYLSNTIDLKIGFLRNELKGQTGDTGYNTIEGLGNNLKATEEKVSNQIYSIGCDETDGSFYVLIDEDNTLINPQVSGINQVTGDVVLGFNVDQ